MKLLKLTSRYYIWTFVSILIIHTPLSYLTINYFVHQRLKRSLLKDKQIVLQELLKNKSIPSFPGFTENELSIDLVSSDKIGSDVFRSIILYSQREESQLKFFELSTCKEIEDRTYLVKIRRSLAGTYDLISSLIFSSVLTMVILLTGLFFVNKYINTQVWRGFYETLDKLRKFELHTDIKTSFSQTQIKEFKELNQALDMLTNKISQDYQRQKYFIENASHELQTPLAIIHSQLELILQSERLKEEEMQLISIALNATDRLSKINKSLIMLSRIENKQYGETKTVDITTLIEDNIQLFSPEIQKKSIDVKVRVVEPCLIDINEVLADILVKNLIHNAIRHNIPMGKLAIEVRKGRIEVKNTGLPLAEEPSRLFERFIKQSDSEVSIGLGLSIVKQICELYYFKINYFYEKGIHQLVLNID